MKVAIIHYWFITRRGGEKVVESILKIFPDADIYTLFYDRKSYGNFLDKHNVYSSVLNTPFLRKYYQKIFPLYPLGIKSLKLKKKYDLIISSESGPTKGVEINNGTPHICYIHSPMRYCWSHKEIYVNSAPYVLKPIMRFFLNRLRKWDLSTIDNVDLYLSNSKNVEKRVKNFYNKESVVVYPPISDELFQKPIEKHIEKNIYLSFGAITTYKRIDLLVDTFNKNGKKLIIIGDGIEKKKLQKRATKNIEFKGSLEWNEIEFIFSRTRALLFPGEEDFGMIPLEVMAYGIPVLAYKKGGALETIVENINKVNESSGLFFDNQDSKSIQKTIDLFEKVEQKFDPMWIRKHAFAFRETQFNIKFKEKIKDFLIE